MLKTDFYDPTSGQTGGGSCPPAPEDKGGGPGGGGSDLAPSPRDAVVGSSRGGKGRSSHVFYRGAVTPQDKYDRDGYNNRNTRNRYQEEFPRARPPYRNGPFNQEG